MTEQLHFHFLQGTNFLLTLVLESSKELYENGWNSLLTLSYVLKNRSLGKFSDFPKVSELIINCH